MRIKKRIEEYFNSVPLPSAEKILPQTALVEKPPVQRAKPILRFALAVFCVGVILSSLLLVLDKTPEPADIPDDALLSSSEESSDTSSNHYGIDESSKQESSEDIYNSDVYGSVPEPDDNTQGVPDVSDNQEESSVFDGDIHDEVPVDPDFDESPVEPDCDNGDDGNAGASEFVGDMFRPEGYDKKIGSVLAVKMSKNENADAGFWVYAHTLDSIDLYALLTQTVGTVAEYGLEIDGKYAGEIYCVYATEAEINQLVEYGLRCSYIGSGEGDINSAEWGSDEWLEIFCEYAGDMYTFQNGIVKCNPDIYVTE